METNHRKTCTVLYAVFAVTALLQFHILAVLVGALAALGAVIAAYNGREDAEGTPYESHYTWLIRTFWIAGGVYLPVLTVIATAVLYTQMDTTSLQEKIISGEISDPLQMPAYMLQINAKLIRNVAICTTLPMLAWWFWRCGKGYGALKKGEPVANAKSWL